MKIAFRVDASSQIGTGHFMRCLTIADALKQSGVQITFVSRHLPGHLREILMAKAYEFLLLDTNQTDVVSDELAHSHWLGATQGQDEQATTQALSGRELDWLIVDHYALDYRWESALRQVTKQIMAIDDIADRRHDCDVLLDQNLYADMDSRYIGKVPEHCVLLLGPRYALLRDEFRQMREKVKPRTGPVKRMLVFFGGVDVNNYTGQAVEALVNLALEGLHVDVVIGAQHPQREQIESACAEHRYDCHVQTSRMAELIAAADLGIGAGGSTTWERCCFGLPTLAFSNADNQQKQVVDAAQEGLLCSPEIRESLSLTIQRHCGAIIDNSCLRQFISRKCMQTVDCQGVFRVIKKLGCSGDCGAGGAVVDVRLAVADDALLVWPWRNNEETRRYFFDPAPVGLNTHLEWWNQSLSNSQRLLLLGKLGGREVGVIRYDFVESRQAKVSIYLNPEMRGRGVGECCLRAGQDWIFRHHPEIDTVVAEVMPKNIASMRVFLAAGFQEQHMVLLMKRRPE